MIGREDEREPLLTRVVDGAPIAMVTIDPMGTITFCAEPSEALFGYTAEELTGTNILDYVDLDWNPLALESIGTALEGHGLRLPMLFRIVTKDGTRRVVEVTANSQVDDPVVKGMIVYVRSWDEQSRLDEILEAIAGDHPLEEKLRMFVEVMAAETLASVGAVLHQPERGSFVRVAAAAGLDGRLGGDALLSTGPDTPWSTALATGEEQLVPCDELPSALRSVASRHGYRACWAYPVRGSAGTVEACLVMWRLDERPMEESYLMVIRRLCRLTQLVLEQDRSRAQLVHAANHDALTGLHNRAAFFGRFQDLLDDPGRRTLLIGVLYLDLDGFKPVNDQLGHGAGDAVLVAIAQRLAHRVRGTDLVARLGGDEFAVLCPDVQSTEELEHLAQRLADAAREPVTVGDHVVQVGASVGVAVAPAGSCSIDALVESADGALYDVKANNTGGWRVVALPAGADV